MKINPITFKLDNGEGNGFTPFRDDKGNWVYKRDVVAKPFGWKCGAGITFSIIEYYFSMETGLREREIACQTFYDKDHLELLTIMTNLASGDLRGYGAEMAANNLYWNLFLPTKHMQEFLPSLYEFYQTIKEKQ